MTGPEEILMIKDPNILLSYLNTKLRDEYPSLEEFCQSTDESREEIEQLLGKIGYVYDLKTNRFVRAQ